ncbi:hypothetical protein [Amycolatopsis sp. NPDC059021]|uniref:hypothetical protein n=1 Tax=Amycolatopsis sp. NPDC059021 TaxID=3346704 RepID=UPI003672F117
MNVAWWALGVSVLSLLAASGSLAWNIYSFHRAGPQIVVKIGMSCWMDPPSELGVPMPAAFKREYVPHPLPGEEPLLSDDEIFIARRMRFTVTVHNTGRAPVNLDLVSVTASPPRIGPSAHSWEEAHLPIRMEQGVSHIFEISAHEVIDQARVKVLDIPSFQASARLGNGKRVLSNKITYPEYMVFALGTLAHGRAHNEAVAKLREKEK